MNPSSKTVTWSIPTRRIRGLSERVLRDRAVFTLLVLRGALFKISDLFVLFALVKVLVDIYNVINNRKLQIACVFLRVVSLLLLLFCAEVDGLGTLLFLGPPRRHGCWRFRPLDWAYGGE